MQPFSRSERLRKQIQKDVAEIVQSLKDPRINFVTITDVELPQDMKIAKVYFTLMERDKKAETERVLNRAAGFVRNQLFHKLNMKEIPKIKFIYDTSAEKAERINRILESLRDEINKEDNR